MIVQRTAIPSDRVERFIDTLPAPLVLDLDDDLFALGAKNEEYGHQLAGLERLLEAADLVIVSTVELARRIVQRGVPTLVVENAIDERLFFAGPIGGAQLRAARMQALYVGTPTHNHDLALLKPAFARLQDVRVPVGLTVASRFPPGHQSDWYQPLSVPPGRGGYPQFAHWLRSRIHEFDLAVAPLANTTFNTAKSDLKFLEYAALRLPGVFSRLEPYGAVQDGVTGLLVDNDVDAWVDAITLLAEDRQARDGVAQRAFDYVRHKRLIRHTADRLLAALFDVVAAARPPGSPLQL